MRFSAEKPPNHPTDSVRRLERLTGRLAPGGKKNFAVFPVHKAVSRTL